MIKLTFFNPVVSIKSFFNWKTWIGFFLTLLFAGVFALLGSLFLFPIGTIIGGIVGLLLASVAVDKWKHPEKYKLFSDKCPFCGKEYKWEAWFEEKNGGITCPACKNRSVIKAGKLLKLEEAKLLS